MPVCSNCHKNLDEGANFCNTCGFKVLDVIYCSNCGEQIMENTNFCRNCKSSTVGNENSINLEVKLDNKENKTIKNKLLKKPLIFSGLGFLVLLLIIFLTTSSFFSGNQMNYGLYLKDREIIYNDYSKDGITEITNRLLDDWEITNQELTSVSDFLGSLIAFNNSRDRIFFPDRINNWEDGFTLYYRDLDKANTEAVKIDSEIILYSINEAGDQILYVKQNDRILYLHDLKDRQKIASNVYNYYFTDDFKRIGYLTEEDSFYLWSKGKEKMKLASDISYLRHVSNDLSTIYYLKDDALYKQVVGKTDKDKIASDVSHVINIYDSGEIYYTKEETLKISLLDYVNDDLLTTDINITKPEYPDYPLYPDYPTEPEYPWYGDYDSDEAYDKAMLQYERDYEAYDEIINKIYEAYEQEYNKIDEAYELAYSQYLSFLDREELRKDLQNEITEYITYTLYYYDGKETTVVTDSLVDEVYAFYAEQTPVLVLDKYNFSKMNKLKLSEIDNYYDVSEMVLDFLYHSSEKYIANEDTLTLIEDTDASMFRLSEDGSVIYYLDNLAVKDVGDLYKITISNGKPNKPELFDTDVNYQGLYFIKDSELAYYKNVKDEYSKGDLYINKKEIDTDVPFYNIVSLNNKIIYYTEYNLTKNIGTLKMYDNGKKLKIADDVRDFTITVDGNILYLNDYSPNYYKGSLYLYNNGKPTKVDDDVNGLLPISNHTNKRGIYYGW